MDVHYRKILVPLDGSNLSTEALPHARALATVTGAALILFQVVPDPSSRGEVLDQSRNIIHSEDRERAFIDQAARWLQGVAEALQLHHLDAEAVVQVGAPALQIVDYAREQHIDLIIMSTHGRSGLARWVYGSVADKVLQSAPCPVLLVRSSVAGAGR